MSRPMAIPPNLAKTQAQHSLTFKLQRRLEAAIRDARNMKAEAQVAQLGWAQARATQAADLKVMTEQASTIKGLEAENTAVKAVRDAQKSHIKLLTQANIAGMSVHNEDEDDAIGLQAGARKQEASVKRAEDAAADMEKKAAESSEERSEAFKMAKAKVNGKYKNLVKSDIQANTSDSCMMRSGSGNFYTHHVPENIQCAVDRNTSDFLSKEAADVQRFFSGLGEHMTDMAKKTQGHTPKVDTQRLVLPGCIDAEAAATAAVPAEVEASKK
ncbi:unnamed protein product [Zymoseptoria tritici ST99CH_1E4]|uniref:Uncharacterized protein n=1 Tax=Zymoseptoria tritici ST99CH_1E4 TaxID=1276532 RepID=A0A2H1FNU0_ZYMTR|nr:unnamed protein product [Zymoseptoria tritici ST99CH_1E4]